MPRTNLQNLPDSILKMLPTPCFALELEALQRNLNILKHVKEASGAQILLALKGFSMWSVFPQISTVLDGTCASGLWEAMLGRDTFGKMVHTFSPAYEREHLKRIIAVSDHVVFNSFSQWETFSDLRQQNPKKSFGLRVNPQYAEVEVDLYNPCGKNSRLGIKIEDFKNHDLTGVSGLHFHTHCQQNSDSLERTLTVFERDFGEILSRPEIKWVNFGGGHHITRPDYDIDRLISLIKNFTKKYHVQVILEPGEAIALNTGVLITTVLDIVENNAKIAIMDISISCHMPDVLEMPYRPEIMGSGLENEKPYNYILAGNSCLAGDVGGVFSFDQPLKVGDRLVFTDSAHYTMVKTTFFNGVKHPVIATYSTEKNQVRIIREFHYTDFKTRLS